MRYSIDLIIFYKVFTGKLYHCSCSKAEDYTSNKLTKPISYVAAQQ